jgi:hypothetical protein
MKEFIHIDRINTLDLTIEWSKMLAETQEEYNSKLNFESSVNIKKGDRIYFLKGTTVPRFKIRNKIKHLGASITNSLSAATIVVGSPEAIDNIVTKAYTHLCCSKNLITWLERYYPIGCLDLIKLSQAINKLGNPKVLVSFYNTELDSSDLSETYKQKMEAQNPDYDENTDPENPSISTWIYSFKGDVSEDLKEAYTKNLLKMVSQEALLKDINTDNITIDRQTFEELRVMFNSTDNQNKVLAMEIMANADYEKSLVYLLLLLKEFEKEIYGSKEKKHVNFKALLNYTGFQFKQRGATTIDDIVEILKKKNAYTKESLEIILPIVQEDLIYQSEHFEFKAQIKPEIQDQLSENSNNVEVVDDDSELELNLD